MSGAVAQENKKPPYAVPSMQEIAERRGTSGYRIVSTFSGCGGSCLGFEMAGFEVLWASEFIAAARRTYEENHPGIPVNERDIREVCPDEILSAISCKRGEIDVLEGSPPCSSFSTAGKQQRGWGQVTPYSDTRQRTDDLFFEFARILRGLQPKIFVAENVSGLVRGVAKGYFKEILSELRSSGYQVEARVLNAKWLGVPQSRERLIFIGVREDLGLSPQFPSPLSYSYSIRDALPWIRSMKWMAGYRLGQKANIDDSVPTLLAGGGITTCSYEIESETDISRYAIGKEWDTLLPGQSSEKYFNLVRPNPDKPCPTLTQTAKISGAASVTHPYEKRKFAIFEAKRLSGFPDDFKLSGSYSERWERLGRAVPPVMMFHIASAVKKTLESL